MVRTAIAVMARRRPGRRALAEHLVGDPTASGSSTTTANGRSGTRTCSRRRRRGRRAPRRTPASVALRCRHRCRDHVRARDGPLAVGRTEEALVLLAGAAALGHLRSTGSGTRWRPAFAAVRTGVTWRRRTPPSRRHRSRRHDGPSRSRSSGDAPGSSMDVAGARPTDAAARGRRVRPARAIGLGTTGWDRLFREAGGPPVGSAAATDLIEHSVTARPSVNVGASGGTTPFRR